MKSNFLYYPRLSGYKKDLKETKLRLRISVVELMPGLVGERVQQALLGCPSRYLSNPNGLPSIQGIAVIFA
jgi:hypothetical protein